MEIKPANLSIKNWLMDMQQILGAPLLDIIFEGRNKDYGAYCLRKEYNRRLKKSMFITGMIVSLVLFLFFFASSPKQEAIDFIPDNILVELPPPHDRLPDPMQPTRPVASRVPVLKTLRFNSPPTIMRDKDVLPEEVPPQNSSLTDVQIDLFTRDGIESEPGFVSPQGTGDGVTGSMASLVNHKDSIFLKVEIESTYPGGQKAWARFLNRTVDYPRGAAELGMQGTVTVKFIVDQWGNTTSIEAIGGPDELKAEAVRVIKKSGQWNPAMQNGHKVKSYKLQPISFRLVQE